MPIICTRVFELPESQDARAKFIDTLNTLIAECGVTMAGGSVHNEMAYADRLEKELAEEIGEGGVEEIRQEFERDSR
jgi:recombinational DNA repair ATPase RecF